MKIKVEFELTPQEFRESLGLPNISALQDEALAMLRDRITSNVENLDLAEIVESWFSQGIAASRKVQEVLVSAASSILDGEPDDTAASTKKTNNLQGTFQRAFFISTKFGTGGNKVNNNPAFGADLEPFMGIPSFMRLPVTRDLDGIDCLPFQLTRLLHIKTRNSVARILLS